jgi:arylsulfatase A-like enzyme
MQRPLTRRDFLKLAALLPALGIPIRLAPFAPSQAQPSNRPNLLVIVFDTFSGKHTSLYGYPRATTPNLARFARHATVFHRHYAAGNFTTPGTASLLTGAYPWTQRAFNLDGTVVDEFERKTLFRAFEDAGYYRVAYTHNWLVVELLNQFRRDVSYWKPLRELCLMDTELSDRLAGNDHTIARSAERIMAVRNAPGTTSLFLSMLDKFFASNERKALLEKYATTFPRGLPTNDETIYFVLEDAINWIQTEVQQAPQPFLGYFHLLPPHEPYNPRRDFIGRFDGDGYVEPAKPLHPLGTSFDERAETTARRNYDEMIAYADSEFGRLYDFLMQKGILDNTYLVFTSDHGQILERGTRGHQNPLLYESITHIPLIISKPGQKDHIDVTSPTSCLDLLPTLTYLAGQPIPDWCEGEVLPTLGGKATSGRSIFTVEAKRNPKQAPIAKATLSMVKDEYKVIQYLGYGSRYDDYTEVYDLKNDPEELTDLHTSNPGLSSDMRNELMDKLQAVNRAYQTSGA